MPKQRRDAFVCVMFAGMEGLLGSEKGQKNGKLGSSLLFLPFCNLKELLVQCWIFVLVTSYFKDLHCCLVIF